MHNVTLKLYWIYARARAAVPAKGHIHYCLVGSIDLPRHCHLKGPYYRDGVPIIGTLLAFWVPIGSLFIFQGPYFQCFGFIHAKNINSVCMYTSVS